MNRDLRCHHGQLPRLLLLCSRRCWATASTWCPPRCPTTRASGTQATHAVLLYVLPDKVEEGSPWTMIWSPTPDESAAPRQRQQPPRQGSRAPIVRRLAIAPRLDGRGSCWGPFARSPGRRGQFLSGPIEMGFLPSTSVLMSGPLPAIVSRHL
jgi:hypothetical protein